MQCIYESSLCSPPPPHVKCNKIYNFVNQTIEPLRSALFKITTLFLPFFVAANSQLQNMCTPYVSPTVFLKNHSVSLLVTKYRTFENSIYISNPSWNKALSLHLQWFHYFSRLHFNKIKKYLISIPQNRVSQCQSQGFRLIVFTNQIPIIPYKSLQLIYSPSFAFKKPYILSPAFPSIPRRRNVWNPHVFFSQLWRVAFRAWHVCCILLALQLDDFGSIS